MKNLIMLAVAVLGTTFMATAQTAPAKSTSTTTTVTPAKEVKATKHVVKKEANKMEKTTDGAKSEVKKAETKTTTLEKSAKK